MIASFVVALTKNWKLALSTFCVIPYILIVTGLLASLDAKIDFNIRALYSKASTLAEEAISSITTILSLDGSKKLVDRYKTFVNGATSIALWRGPLQSMIYGNMWFAVHSIYGLALFYGARLLNWGEIKSGGTVLTVIYCIVMGSSSLGFVAPVIPDFIKAAAAAKSVLEALNESQSKKPPGEKHQSRTNELIGHVQIDHVSFRYPSRPTVSVLNNASMSFAPNQVTALVGPSGSGKSTIIALLERWYEVSEGSISVHGVDINEVDLEWWRAQVSLVQQVCGTLP